VAPSVGGGPTLLEAILIEEPVFKSPVFPVFDELPVTGSRLPCPMVLTPLTGGTITGVLVDVEGCTAVMIFRGGLVNDREGIGGPMDGIIWGIELRLLIIDMSLTPVWNLGIPSPAGMPW